MVVLWRLMWYPGERCELFLLLTDKMTAGRRAKNRNLANLVLWKWHHIAGGWRDDEPTPEPFTCPYTQFPAEGLPKEEAVRALLQCVYYRRYTQGKYGVHYRLPRIDYIFKVGNDYMPQDLWVGDEDPNEFKLPLTLGQTSYRTIHRTYDLFRREMDGVFAEVQKVLPKDVYATYVKGQDERGKLIGKQQVMYIAQKNAAILHAMIRDFAQGIRYDIHSYYRGGFERSERENWWYVNKKRAKEKFDERYVQMAFLEHPFKAPTEEDEEKMDEKWVDDAIRRFSQTLRGNRSQHQDPRYKRIVTEIVNML